jgi:hypothetical protein
MAKDYLNIIERALMMGVSDKLNTATATGSDIFVRGQFPQTDDIQFPSVIIQLVNSGFEEKYFGESVTFGAAATASTGEVYGCTYLVHIIVDKDTEITIGSDVYKQRRLINWLMLNIANSVMEIDWSVYEEEELEILERHLNQWRDIGFMPQSQWHGATAEFSLAFLNKR